MGETLFDNQNIGAARNLNSYVGSQSLIGDTINLFDCTTGNLVATLPTAVGIAGDIITVQKTDATANLLTMASTSSQTINGSTASSVILRKQGWSFDFVSDGANWKII